MCMYTCLHLYTHACVHAHTHIPCICWYVYTCTYTTHTLFKWRKAKNKQTSSFSHFPFSSVEWFWSLLSSSKFLSKQTVASLWSCRFSSLGYQWCFYQSVSVYRRAYYLANRTIRSPYRNSKSDKSEIKVTVQYKSCHGKQHTWTSAQFLPPDSEL